jgi:hypothetical protein
MSYAAARPMTSMSPEREHWVRRVAGAAQRAADDLRQLDDPSTHDLLRDLDELHDRLVAELRAAGLAR